MLKSLLLYQQLLIVCTIVTTMATNCTAGMVLLNVVLVVQAQAALAQDVYAHSVLRMSYLAIVRFRAL